MVVVIDQQIVEGVGGEADDIQQEEVEIQTDHTEKRGVLLF